MEKKYSHPPLFKVNLKHLPPIDPATATTTTTAPTSQVKKGKPNASHDEFELVKPRLKEGIKLVKFDEEANTKADLLADNTNLNQGNIKTVDDASFCSIKHVDPNNIVKFKSKSDETTALYNHPGGSNKVSAKARLHEICAAKKWKPPLFECCKEEGPCHMKLVVVEVEETPCTILECLGAPRSTKKTATEHAAEGALWYLKHLDYIPIKKGKK